MIQVNDLLAFSRRLDLTLWPGQIEILSEWLTSGKRRLVLCVGRRSGKGLMAAVVALFNAIAMAGDYEGSLRRGEVRFILAIATRAEQAREFIRTCRELLDNADPDVSALLDRSRSTADELVLTTGVVIRAMPCSSRATRGLAVSLVVLDEFGWFQTDSEGFAAAKHVWQAVTPSIAQFGDRGFVVVTSTPRFSSGKFYELVEAGERGSDPDLCVIRRPTWAVNPSISREDLEGEFQADPQAAMSEYGAEFGGGVGAYLDADAVYACIVRDRPSLPPIEGISYVGALDPAFSADAFALCIAHRVGQGDAATVVVDRLVSWKGGATPLNSDAVLDDAVDLLRQYRIDEVISDQFSLAMVTDALRRRGITVRPMPWTADLKYAAFSTVKRLINLARIELLDNDNLAGELLSLEIKPLPSGKARIAAAGGRHDDLAMTLAAVVHRLIVKRPSVIVAGPSGLTRVSPWLGEGAPVDALAGTQSIERNATRGGVSSPDPSVRVPEGSVCPKPGCGASAWNTNGRCVRCDTPAPGVSSGGTWMPVLLSKR